MERTTLALSGLSCGHCVSAVRKALLAVKGVSGAEVTLDPMRAVVDYDPGSCSVDDLVAAVKAERYGAEPGKG